MKHCRYITTYNVRELADQVDRHPELWDEHTLRTEWKDGPFTDTSDIWVRFGRGATSQPHFSEFYRGWDLLPALHPIVFDLMHRVQATMLGGILLARIPPGKSIPWHTDKGSWHAEFYTLKAYVIISSNPQCINRYEDEEVIFKAGEAWLFNNLVQHSVENRGDTERVAAIICMRDL